MAARPFTTAGLMQIRGLLSDMDGVWFVGDKPVPGAIETLARLRARDIPLRLVTNTTTKTASQLAARMKRMGLDVSPSEFVTTPVATMRYLREKAFSSVRLVVADSIRGEFAGVAQTTKPDAVVIGDVGSAFDYDLMQDLFRTVMDGAELVAMHKGRYWQVEDGLRMDIGAFIAGLEYASGKTATVIGKPSREMFRAALASLGLPAAQVVMVGDDVDTDVAGAQRAGIRGVLVKTGKYREAAAVSSGVKPDLVLDSVADLAALL